ncbi:hypothetical protein CJEDD_03045 [Corynebacterium jeddahense]|uniref:Uncharacterized protein n=1 Tax=Corynebacterium jeddahense TaxID=1414719 RepID=A0ABY7UHT8_9CORY|nr:hypothetical protein CJEDD_03045 [Corynebacterium jeddahense]
MSTHSHTLASHGEILANLPGILGFYPNNSLIRFVSSGCERVWVLDRDGLWGWGGLGGGADDADFCREACASFGVR